MIDEEIENSKSISPKERSKTRGYDIYTYRSKADERDNSLNYVSRTLHFKRIMTENEQLLSRLMTRKSNYNVMDWENDRKE